MHFLKQCMHENDVFFALVAKQLMRDEVNMTVKSCGVGCTIRTCICLQGSS